MKRIALFVLVIVAVFSSLGLITKYQEHQLLKNNPFKKTDLHAATIKQLKDPHYQNIILPDELEDKLKNKEDVTVYFYSPTCIHCTNTTPIVVPLAEEIGVDLKLFNVLEFPEWEKYNVRGTPTIVHYKDGEEVDRIVGAQDKSTFALWFGEHVLGFVEVEE